MIYIVMGVSGCGKSSIGQMLADQLKLAFYDADDFHPAANIKKMSSGVALDDNDRWPWLTHLADQMPDWLQQGGAVLACSALKQAYRDVLASTQAEQIKFVYLAGSKQLIGDRLAHRQNHFMASTLLDSQFEALEAPTDAITVSIDSTPDVIVARTIEEIKK